MHAYFADEFKVNRVIAKSSTTYPASVRFKFDGTQYLDEKDFAMVTGFRVTFGTNYQIIPALDDVVYLYAFGNKPTEITVTGIAFPAICSNGRVGIVDFFDFFKKNRITTRASKIPEIQVTIADKVLTGFLTDMTLEIQDPSTRIAQFQMTLRSATL